VTFGFNNEISDIYAIV